jgi:Colicin D
MMRHPKDLGWPRPFREKEFEEIVNHIIQKMNDPNVIVINGTHRGTQQVYHFYNQKTGVVIMVDKQSNDILSFWKLGPDQIFKLLKTGDIR